MAGIGFTLRQLTRQDNVAGIIRAYGHASVTTSGPWLATVLALGTISLAGQGLVNTAYLETFRLVVIYNFALSLLMCGPIMLVATRQISDLIFAKRLEDCAGVFLTAVALVMLLGLPLAVGLYAGYGRFSLPITLAACINFLLISAIWTVSIFLTVLKTYNRVTLSFVCGLVLGTSLAITLAPDFGTFGLLLGFNAGLTVTLFALIGQVYAEYPPGPLRLKSLLRGLRTYWLLAISGLVYNAALWVDKFVMWLLAPERTVHESGLVIYPAYDSAMFTAFLTVVPGLSLFMVIVETSFFERYHRFYQDLLNHATFSQIRRNQTLLIETLTAGMRNLIVIQGAISVFFLLGASQVYDILGIDFSHLTMFRFGVIASFFQTLMMFVLVVLAYFDLRRLALGLQLFFLVTSGVFTYITIELGYAYYGFGVMFATGLSFLTAYIALARFVQNLPYEAFIANNESVS
ncbi:hypothetical protein CKO28_14760 [Rhodovibrio sodomensis]|uniref:Histidine kinase n=1 Tax=Rhodovibrio sodomensis TaxID=1088 RepID=A0ABS1DH36_9PROT|nr:exopolysaccharide Pel transporter PelG [Rhodovibrio sodomensis]MBK1669296.1 hypothetical protein [Rhodovibrio sodomensis]